MGTQGGAGKDSKLTSMEAHQLKDFEITTGGERFYIGADVGRYLKLDKGALYKKYPGLYRHVVTPSERKLISEQLNRDTPLASLFGLVRKEEVDQIIEGQGESFKITQDTIFDVAPGDSISNVSQSSTSSSIKHKMVEEEANRRALLIKLRNLDEQSKLDEQQLLLEKQSQRLKIQSELEQSKARYEAYEELSDVNSHHAATHVSRSLPKVAHTNDFSAMVAGLTLPKQDIPIFTGKSLEYLTFIRSFEYVIEKQTSDPVARLYYLMQYTTGEVKELINSFLSMPAEKGYSAARAALAKRFGSSYKIACAYVDRVLAFPNIKSEDSSAMRKYSVLLTSCQNTLDEVGFLNKIENIATLRQVIMKLPFELRRKWRAKADFITEDLDREITLVDVVNFIDKEARAVNHPMFGDLSLDDHQVKSKGIIPSSANKKSTFVTNAEGAGKSENTGPTFSQNGASKPRFPCVVCNDEHRVYDCLKLKSMDCEHRVKCAKEKGLCFNCLIPKHRVQQCRKPPSCTICSKKHHTLLHLSTYDKPEESQYKTDVNKSSKSETKDASSAYIGSSAQKIGLPIVGVKVRAKGGAHFVDTLALLDNCSNTTFCTEELKNKVKAVSKKAVLRLTTLDKQSVVTDTEQVDLEVYDPEGTVSFDLNSVYTRPCLPVSSNDQPTQEEVNRWPYLQGVQVCNGKSVGLLIGNDNHMVMQPSEIKRSSDGGPFALKTPLGWVINGPYAPTVTEKSNTVNFVCTEPDGLEDQFQKFCNREFSDSLVSSEALSQNDKRALDLMQSSVELQSDGHYMMDLPWKEKDVCLPKNRSLAEMRLANLKKKLMSDTVKCGQYFDYMNELVKKGYAEKIPDIDGNRNDGMVWYLPHQSVTNPKKPNKVRIVFDCSSKYKGVSLNDMLLQGPDLTNKLFGVLTRFRQEEIAIMADIEAMFLQVQVSPKHRDVLRFLWWSDENAMQENKTQEFRMTVHLFGATSSPTCSNFAVLKTAEDNQHLFDNEVIESVKKNFYVDDCLKSVESVDSAKKHATQLQNLLNLGGFHLTKWISNNPDVLDIFEEKDIAKSVRVFDKYNCPVDSALGMQWDIKNDTLGYNVVVKDQPTTRRGILSVTSSTYDPLGFVTPFVLPAKIILQDLCRMKLDWDDSVTGEPLFRWKKWLMDLPKLDSFKIPRCVKPAGFKSVSNQLHHFSDASEKGYGAVTYMRQIDEFGQVHCVLLMSKSRVTPLKTVSIPRLELSAAVLATRLDQMLKQELEIDLESSIFWTDSTSVIKYIENAERRFQTFVANRVSKIRDVSTPEQWNYVNTAQNPADYVSRGLSADKLLESCWLTGPEFLWKPQEFWPKRPPNITHMSSSDNELRKERNVCVVSKQNSVIDDIIFSFSNWRKLKKCFAWILRYKAKLYYAVKCKKEGKSVVFSEKLPLLTVEEMDSAENAIIKYTQKQYFSVEEQKTKGDLKFKISSSLQKLCPVLRDELICVGGRLDLANIEEGAKHPIVLPKGCHVTKLLIEYFHQLTGHSGQEAVLSHMRKKYWIIKGSQTVRNVLSKCHHCRRHFGKCGKQIMADLPTDRVTSNKTPFYSTGVDCFGPFIVKRGRSEVKRYGVIFTCMTIRAIHIEIVHSLDTSSFINALRRFIARRGQPEEFRSDNGGNFVSGASELKKAINDWNQKQIHEFLLQQNIRWKFNPPAASHQGGVWERCIRTIRKVLTGLLHHQTLDDESLPTLMCEVESIVNNRPITKVSSDPSDLEALTPNHLLLLKEGPCLPPGIFMRQDTYSKRRWRQVQYLADQFWRRWTREYLPTLQMRQKWLKPDRNFAINDLVLVVDENSPRSKWSKGVVKQIFPDRHGLVRQVDLKTAQGFLKRDIRKLCLLENL